MRRFRSVAVTLAGLVLALLAVAGCADTQPGDQNPGVGYTNNISDLRVKIPALQADPCRGAQAGQLYGNCGRFVTEVSGTVNALRADVPGHTSLINALAGAVNRYQSLDCDTITGRPTANQRTTCPAALTSIGTDLDRLGNALASAPSGRP
jgi:outer membrane murein-binding lipoprotein Lpp